MSDDFVIICNNQSWLYGINEIRHYTEKVKKKTNNNKKKKELPVQFQIFKNIMKFTEDQYWKSIFDSASLGKMLPDVQYKDEHLIYKNKNKITNKKIDLDDEKKAFEDIFNFLKNVVGINSPNDLSNKKKINENENNTKEISWTQIKQVYKLILINKYVDKICNNNDDKKKIKDVIISGIVANYLNQNNIILENGEIKEIKGLQKDQNNNFYIDFNLAKVKNRKQNKNKETNEVNTLLSCTTKNVDNFTNNEKKINISFIQQWEKFLKTKNKRFNKYKK